MENAMLEMSVPARANVTVKRSTRPREYLTEREIEKLIEAAGGASGRTVQTREDLQEAWQDLQVPWHP